MDVLLITENPKYKHLNGYLTDFSQTGMRGNTYKVIAYDNNFFTIELEKNELVKFKYEEVILIEFELNLKLAEQLNLKNSAKRLRIYREKMIRACCQMWYDSANWSGYAITFLGKLSPYRIDELASEFSIKLTYNCPA
jgi:hypothetical protein